MQGFLNTKTAKELTNPTSPNIPCRHAKEFPRLPTQNPTHCCGPTCGRALIFRALIMTALKEYKDDDEDHDADNQADHGDEYD